ncbi:MAG TPA: hypothetical protein VGF28_11070 [Thermoanaerobaculia bacterium]|jgi:hypothetical protein
MANLIERHQRDVRGVLSFLDRVVIQGTIPSVCHPKAMATTLDSRGIRLFDYTQFVQPLRDAIRAHAEKIAAEEGVTVEYIRKMKTFRKEDRIQQILAERGDQSGLVHILSAMEPCSSYEPWHDKATGNTVLRRDTGKCLHYYFYFIDDAGPLDGDLPLFGEHAKTITEGDRVGEVVRSSDLFFVANDAR